MLQKRLMILKFEEMDLTVSIVDYGKQSGIVIEAHFDAFALSMPTKKVMCSPTTS